LGRLAERHAARLPGKYYQFSLMTLFFSPAPLRLHIPIYIAGVNPLRLQASRRAVHAHIHPFH
jgi:hypothetical protein